MTIDIERIFARLPEAEKKLPCCIVAGKSYTWEQAIELVRKKNPLGEKIKKELERFVTE